jgi:hypothetical protein
MPGLEPADVLAGLADAQAGRIRSLKAIREGRAGGSCGAIDDPPMRSAQTPVGLYGESLTAWRTFCKIPETGGTRSHPADLRRLYPRRPNSLRGLVRRDGAPPSRPVWGVMMANPTLAISRAEQASGPRLRGVMASPSGRCNSVRLDWAPRSGVGLTDEPSSIRSATGTGETTGASSSHRCRAVG